MVWQAGAAQAGFNSILLSFEALKLDLVYSFVMPLSASVAWLALQ